MSATSIPGPEDSLRKMPVRFGAIGFYGSLRWALTEILPVVVGVEDGNTAVSRIYALSVSERLGGARVFFEGDSLVRRV